MLDDWSRVARLGGLRCRLDDSARLIEYAMIEELVERQADGMVQWHR
jgi:hypothetical protein